MKYRKLGKTGLTVSEVGFGAREIREMPCRGIDPDWLERLEEEVKLLATIASRGASRLQSL